jgi:hypothetical protein
MSKQGFDSIDMMARILCSDLDFSDVNDSDIKEIVSDL